MMKQLHCRHRELEVPPPKKSHLILLEPSRVIFVLNHFEDLTLHYNSNHEVQTSFEVGFDGIDDDY